ncbi:hypothetical protein RI545_12980 [Lactiplantibacillus pentosus]|nr:hypothetical protein [Lactiplantibacillus pentosus]MDT7036379.1 hypothetical protein [Lactiplantibacillus pentosus]
MDAPYEAPLNPEITIDTSKQPLADSVKQVLTYLADHNYVSLATADEN